MLNPTVNHPNNALTSSNQKSFGLIKTLINGVWYNDISDTPELHSYAPAGKATLVSQLGNSRWLIGIFGFTRTLPPLTFG